MDKQHYINVWKNRSLENWIVFLLEKIRCNFLGGFCGQDGPGGRTSPARVCWKAMAGPGVWNLSGQNLPKPKSAPPPWPPQWGCYMAHHFWGEIGIAGPIFFSKKAGRPLELWNWTSRSLDKNKISDMKNRFAKIIFVRLRKIVCSGSQNATSLAASKKSQKKRCFFSAQDHCTSLFGRRGGGPQKILDEPFMPWKLQTAVTPWGFAPQNHTKASLIHVWVNHLYSKIFMIRENPPRCFFFFF